MGHPAIELKDLVAGYNRKPVFGPVNAEVPAASLNILVGANGAGKSTLLQTVAGSLPPVSGNVYLDGKDVSTLSRKELSAMLGHVFTEHRSAGGLTVRELVEMGRYPYTGLLGRLSKQDSDIVAAAMERVSVADKADCFLADISDGERQKAMIARALAQNTRILLLDEPTNFLDAASRIEILALLRELVDNEDITVILSTHDVSSVLPLADNVVTLLPGASQALEITPANTPETFSRLNCIFADRNVGFDEKKGDFKLYSRPKFIKNSNL